MEIRENTMQVLELTQQFKHNQIQNLFSIVMEKMKKILQSQHLVCLSLNLLNQVVIQQMKK